MVAWRNEFRQACPELPDLANRDLCNRVAPVIYFRLEVTYTTAYHHNPIPGCCHNPHHWQDRNKQGHQYMDARSGTGEITHRQVKLEPGTLTELADDFKCTTV